MDFAPPAPSNQQSLQPAGLTNQEAAFVSDLFKSVDLDLGSYRTETLRRRLPAALRALGAKNASQARQILQQDHQARWPALSAMVIGVTSFFRDGPVFDYLTLHALPNLATSSRPLRIWSAGCSDGEELYSIGITLAELKLLDRSYLLGTDCRPDAIARARKGLYDQAAVKDVCAPWLDAYFQREKERFRIAAELRDTANWRRADLLSIVEPGYWDLILCRNMAMYLQPEHASRLWSRFEQSLRSGGYLVLGKAERPLGTTRLSAVAPCIYRRDRG